jgi:hypothetical protein
MRERVQAVSGETCKRQNQWRCTTEHEYDLGRDAKHRPSVRKLR